MQIHFRYLHKGFNLALLNADYTKIIEFILGFEKACVKVRQTARRGGKKDRGPGPCSDPDQEEIYDYDEIDATFKVRNITAMEAYLGLHSYRIARCHIKSILYLSMILTAKHLQLRNNTKKKDFSKSNKTLA